MAADILEYPWISHPTIKFITQLAFRNWHCRARRLHSVKTSWSINLSACSPDPKVVWSIRSTTTSNSTGCLVANRWKPWKPLETLETVTPSSQKWQHVTIACDKLLFKAYNIHFWVEENGKHCLFAESARSTNLRRHPALRLLFVMVLWLLDMYIFGEDQLKPARSVKFIIPSLWVNHIWVTRRVSVTGPHHIFQDALPHRAHRSHRQRVFPDIGRYKAMDLAAHHPRDDLPARRSLLRQDLEIPTGLALWDVYLQGQLLHHHCSSSGHWSRSLCQGLQLDSMEGPLQ